MIPILTPSDSWILDRFLETLHASLPKACACETQNRQQSKGEMIMYTPPHANSASFIISRYLFFFTIYLAIDCRLCFALLRYMFQAKYGLSFCKL